MKIISKFRDYYDSFSYVGDYDDDICYHRFTKNEKLDSDDENRLYWIKQLNESYNRSSIHMGMLESVVVFCGKLYLKIYQVNTKLFELYQENYYASYDDKPKFAWNQHLYQKRSWIGNIFQEGKHSHYFNELIKDDWSWLNKKYLSPVIEIQNLVTTSSNGGNRSTSKTTRETRLILNPNLDELGFPAAVDSYIAYHEIERFIDMQLNNQPEIVEISDEDNLKKKGFDKYSFRKDKWKKK